MNACDNDGIVTHVTEKFRQSAIDQAFIANNLGSQMQIEKLTAGNLCDDVGCHVDVTARNSGSQMASAGDIEIELTYVVKFVNGAALVDDVLN